MKKIFITILFCMFLLPFNASAESFSYYSKLNHYSFTIPSGWIEIPRSTIDTTMKEVSDQTNAQTAAYAAGFQTENTPDFQYPYILTQEHKLNTPSYNQILQSIESGQPGDSFAKASKEYSELMSNATSEKPFLDKERNIVFMNMTVDVANVGTVKGLSAMMLGKETLTQLNFYSIESEYTSNLPVFNQIIDSFKYEKGYEYDAEQAKKNDSPNLFAGFMEGGAQGAIIGGIAGGLGALVIALIAKSKKKKL